MNRSRPLLTLLLVIPACAVLGACGGSRGRGGAQANPAAVSGAKPGEQLVDSAESAIRRGDTQQALAELARAIEINPTLTRAHMDMGDIFRSGGDYAAAENSYRIAAEIEPRNFEAQYYNGMMLQLLDRVTEAIGAYLRALALRPSDFDATLRVSTAYYQLDENKPALEYARRAVELRPGSGTARLNLGAVYAAMEDHASALREYQQAAELMPLTSTLLLNMANTLGRLERYTEMKNTLEQLIKSEPSAAAYERLGFAYFKLNDPDRSLLEFQNSLKLDADHYPALNGLGVCYLNRYLLSDQKDVGARSEAISCFRRSLQVNRDQPKVLELLGRYGK